MGGGGMVGGVYGRGGVWCMCMSVCGGCPTLGDLT